MRILFSTLILSLALNTFASDWPQWRGADRNGVNPEKGLANQWPEGGPKLLYKATGVGVGFSSVVIADGTLHRMDALISSPYVGDFFVRYIKSMVQKRQIKVGESSNT